MSIVCTLCFIYVWMHVHMYYMCVCFVIYIVYTHARSATFYTKARTQRSVIKTNQPHISVYVCVMCVYCVYEHEARV